MNIDKYVTPFILIYIIHFCCQTIKLLLPDFCKMLTSTCNQFWTYIPRALTQDALVLFIVAATWYYCETFMNVLQYK